MTLRSAYLIAGLLAVANSAWADIAHGPNPYDPGYGFDTPDEATWGAWTRGDTGTLYAEWDNFASGGLSTSPDAGSYGTILATFGWNIGTAPDGDQNLANASANLALYADLEGTVVTGPIRVAMQLETLGTGMDYDNVLLNGLEPTQISWPYAEELSEHRALLQTLILWDLPSTPAGELFSFDLTATAGTAISQVTLDVGPAAVPLPAAVWLFGSALAGMAVVTRRRNTMVANG